MTAALKFISNGYARAYNISGYSSYPNVYNSSVEDVTSWNTYWASQSVSITVQNTTGQTGLYYCRYRVTDGENTLVDFASQVNLNGVNGQTIGVTSFASSSKSSGTITETFEVYNNIPNSKLTVLGMSSLIVAQGITLPYVNEVQGQQRLQTVVSWVDVSQYLSVKIDGVVVTIPEGVKAYGLDITVEPSEEKIVEISRIEGQEFAKELLITFGSALHKQSSIRVNIPDKLDSNTDYLFPESGTLQLNMPDRSVPIDQWVTANILGSDANIPPGRFTIQVRDVNGIWHDMAVYQSDGNKKVLVSSASATAVGLITGSGQEVQRFREVRVKYESGEMPQEPDSIDDTIPDEWDAGMSETDGEGSDDIETDEWDWIEEGGTTGTKPCQGQQQTGGESGGGGGTPVATCACAQHYIEIADTIRSGATYIGNTFRQAIYYNADETVKNIQALSDNLLAVLDKINNQLSKVQSRLDKIDTDLIKASNQVSDEINFLDDDLYAFREDFYDLTTGIRDGLDRLTESQFVQVDDDEKSISEVLQDTLPVISAALDNPNGLIQQEIYGDNGDGSPSVFTKSFKKGEF